MATASWCGGRGDPGPIPGEHAVLSRLEGARSVAQRLAICSPPWIVLVRLSGFEDLTLESF